MLETLRRRWHELKAGEPGRRFEDRYERRHAEGSSDLRRALTLGAGGLILLVGVVLLAVPGPGIIVMALGAALLARASRRAARFLDASEVRVRGAMAWARRRWTGASTAARALLVLLATVLVAVALWLAWKLMFG